MQIVIDIPEEYKNLLDSGDADGSVRKSILLAVVNGTPLPKGHGRIIDESQIRSVTVRCEEDKIDGWQLHHEYVDGTDAPTIIEADKAESEEEDESI